MRHATEGALRQLTDEPEAVPDLVRHHLAGCARCNARRLRMRQDTERCARLLSGPRLVPDVDVAWARLRRELERPAAPAARRRQGAGRHGAVAFPPRAYRFRRVSLRTGLLAAAAGVVVLGTAAAATLTTVFAPVRVAPLSLSRSDLQEVTAFMGLGNNHVLGGFPRPSGSRALPFGTLAWWSSGRAVQVGSLAQASAAAGFTVRLPGRLPSGVGRVQSFAVQPKVRVMVTFTAHAAGLDGSSVVMDAGPAVLAEYGSANGTQLPTLAILTMPRPTATSTGATISTIEAFLLRQRAIPSDLAEEIRLLGNLGTTLPVPVPPGASVHSVQVGGWPGVLLADGSDTVAGVVWEDGGGTVHLVVGVLDQQDVLNVARQLG